MGFENEVGLRQESHHHHVEGIGTGFAEGTKKSEETKSDHFLEHAHNHDHNHGHVHKHEHPPYPHANHPLGPKTLEENTIKSIPK